MAARSKSGYKKGDPYCICDICGFRCYHSNTSMMYNNLRACTECWDEQQPQDFPPPIPQGELKPFDNPRPEVTIDTFVDTTLLPDWTMYKPNGNAS